jgi:hypothetical protein
MDTMSNTVNYIFQKKNYNSYQCGAYAIYNAILCKAIQTDIRHAVKLKYLINKCKAQKGIGTLVTDFNATLESININIKPVEASLKNIKRACATGGLAPLILFHWTHGVQQGNHYALIDKMYYKYGSYSYRVINYSFDKPIKIISERELKSMLMPYKDEHFQLPQMWSVIL